MKSFAANFIGLFLAAILCMGLFTGCSFKKETKEYVFSHVYIGAQTLLEENKNSNHCEDIYLNEDGSLTLVLTEAQRKSWADTTFSDIVLFGMKQAGITVTYSDDYTSLELCAPQDILTASAPMLQTFAWRAELVQVLNGTEDWSITVTLKDSETGAIVKEFHLPEDEFDWSFLTMESD